MERTPPIEKNDIVSLTIAGLGSEGQGVGRVEGFALFVPGALPGERVCAKVIKLARSYAVGKLLSIEEPSANRVVPACLHFGRCGGCTLQHLAYSAQLCAKRQEVADALVRIGGFSGVEVPPVAGMDDPWHYRNKASFPLAEVDGKVAAGFFAPRSHRLVPVSDCPIQQKAILEAVSVVVDWANLHTLPAYDETTGKGSLRHVVVRVSTHGAAMVTLVSAGPLLHQKHLVSMLRERVPGLQSVYVNHNAARTNVILGPEYRLLWGEKQLEEEIGGLRFRVGPAAFLQINPSQTERLYRTALDFLAFSRTERVLDAYCGVGTISLLLAQHAAEVVGVEDVVAAVADAEANARLNGIENARFLAAPAEKALPALLAQGEAFDAIVADPPRKGCEAAFLDAVLASGAKRMVYASCNPATLARDLKHLAEGGFTIVRVQPVDMFPHTGHVETVCLLSKLNTKQHIEVELNMDELDLTSAESKATYEEIKEYVLEHTGLKVSHLYIAQVKQKHGIIERENYNKPKSENARQPQCPPEKEQAIEEALKYFGMIK